MSSTAMPCCVGRRGGRTRRRPGSTRGEVRRRAALARRAAVAALVPGEDGDVVQAQRLDRLLPAARMFVAAVEQEQRLVRRDRGQPGAVEQLGAVRHRGHVFRRCDCLSCHSSFPPVGVPPPRSTGPPLPSRRLVRQVPEVQRRPDCAGRSSAAGAVGSSAAAPRTPPRCGTARPARPAPPPASPSRA